MQIAHGHKFFDSSASRALSFSQTVAPRRFDKVEVRLARGLMLQVFLTGLAVSSIMLLGMHALGF